MGLAVAPFSFSYTAWFALIPLYLSVVHYSRHPVNYCRLLVLAIIWGTSFYGLALFGITGLHPLTWMGITWLTSLAIAAFCWLTITVWSVILVSIWAVGLGLWSQFLGQTISKHPFSGFPILGRVLGSVTLWCALENLWSNSPLWWCSLSSTQSPNNLWFLQWGQISGPNTLTAAIVLINALLAEVILISYQEKSSLRKFVFSLSLPLSLLIFFHLVGYFLYQHPLADLPQNAISVGIIQGNIPNQINLDPKAFKKTMADYTLSYQDSVKSGAEVIFTPEGALPYVWEDIINYSPLYRAVLQSKIPLLLGAYDYQGKNLTNTLFSLNAQGKLIGRYDKMKLIPFGEYIPLKAFFGEIVLRLSPIKEEYSPGNHQQQFKTDFGYAIVSICYESAFPENFRFQTQQGGEFIISITNNAQFGKIISAQHHALNVMRTIENGRWSASAANTGYSAIISPHGKTLWISELNRYQIHLGMIYRRNTQTLYVKYGDFLTTLLLILSISFAILNVLSRITKNL